MRTTLGMLDFTGQMIYTVINRILRMELEDTDEGMSMTSLRQALPREDEYRFRHAIQ